MNFTFSEEQEMLRDSAREFLGSRYPIEKVAELADGPGFDPSSWSEVAELGWTGISLPEDRVHERLAVPHVAVRRCVPQLSFDQGQCCASGFHRSGSIAFGAKHVRQQPR